MPDNESKRDFRDRARLSADDDDEVDYFALRNGITRDQVRELIRKHGNNRAALETAAEWVRRVP